MALLARHIVHSWKQCKLSVLYYTTIEVGGRSYINNDLPLRFLLSCFVFAVSGWLFPMDSKRELCILVLYWNQWHIRNADKDFYLRKSLTSSCCCTTCKFFELMESSIYNRKAHTVTHPCFYHSPPPISHHYDGILDVFYMASWCFERCPKDFAFESSKLCLDLKTHASIVVSHSFPRVPTKQDWVESSFRSGRRQVSNIIRPTMQCINVWSAKLFCPCLRRKREFQYFSVVSLVSWECSIFTHEIFQCCDEFSSHSRRLAQWISGLFCHPFSEGGSLPLFIKIIFFPIHFQRDIFRGYQFSSFSWVSKWFYLCP